VNKSALASYQRLPQIKINETVLNSQKNSPRKLLEPKLRYKNPDRQLMIEIYRDKRPEMRKKA
jgi:hypothetical protein